MAPKKECLTPHDWISDFFSPCVSVLCSPDAEQILAEKSNLTFTELLQPFSKLTSDVTIKDPEGVNYPVSGLNITFQVCTVALCDLRENELIIKIIFRILRRIP